MKTILINYGIPADGLQALSDWRVVMPKPGCMFTEEELDALLPTCDAAVAAKAFTGKMIEKAQKLRLIVAYGAGYDNIDCACAKAHGIPVCNIPDSVTESTAELAFALMIDCARRTGELNTYLHTAPPEESFGLGKRMGTSLRGSVLGLVGAGRIGKRMGEMAEAFGMRIVYTGHREKAALAARGWRYMPLKEMLAASDFVSLHCPLTDETRHLIDAEAIACMKRGAYLINTSRGAVVDEEALAQALQSGAIAGAGLDVFPDEPHIPACLLQFPNAVLTPHVGSNTVLTRREMAQAVCKCVLDAENGIMPTCVNGL